MEIFTKMDFPLHSGQNVRKGYPYRRLSRKGWNRFFKCDNRWHL